MLTDNETLFVKNLTLQSVFGGLYLNDIEW